MFPQNKGCSYSPAFAESHGLCLWMNAERVPAGALGVGGCASAGSTEDGGATGSARGAPQSYVLYLVFSAWFFLIFSPCFAQAQLDTTVSLDISDNGKSVTVNKKDTIGITLQSNLTPNYQWMLDTAGLNTEV
ncbi:MAG: hypothetical protein ACETVZ_00315, partial [Phycisphaerae bacterium]